jgi:hypothetical protein
MAAWIIGRAALYSHQRDGRSNLLSRFRAGAVNERDKPRGVPMIIADLEQPR